MSRRILQHPILGNIKNNKILTFSFNGQALTARKGETIAAALLAENIRTLRFHEESGRPRGFYCNIGHCYECRVTVNGKPNVRACLTLVEEGMEIVSPGTLDNPLKEWRNERV